MTENALTPAQPSPSLPSLDTTQNLNQGTRLKFVDGRWTSGDGHDMTGAKLLVIHMTRGLRRWHDGSAPEDISEDAGPLPDYKAMNEAISKSEWRIGLNGDPEPPWQMNYCLYFIDLRTYEIFASINSTWGQSAAWNKLNTQVKWCSTVKKVQMFPMITLGSAQMGGKMQKLRPDFAILAEEWVSSANLEQLAPPTLKEEMDGDGIPF